MRHFALVCATAAVLVATSAPVYAIASEIAAAKLAAIRCVYGRLKSNSDVQSVAAYSVDGFRHAIEYTFRGKSAHLLTADMMIGGVAIRGDYGWYVAALHNESDDEGFEELDFLMDAVPDLDSNCHLTPMGDNLLPGAKPRPEWQRIDLEK